MLPDDPGATNVESKIPNLHPQVLVEKGPSQRACTDKLGQAGLDPMSWQGKQLGEFAIHHGKPQCSGDEKLIPLYHHDNQVDHDILCKIDFCLTLKHLGGFQPPTGAGIHRVSGLQ